MSSLEGALEGAEMPGVIEWHQLDKTYFYTLGLSVRSLIAPVSPQPPGPLAQLVTRYFVYPMNLIKTRIQV